MAFYTSRVDDSDNQMERCATARSITSLPSKSNTHFNLTSRSCDPRSSVRISTRRYVNKAAYNEKSSQLNDMINGIEENSTCMSMPETQSDIVPPLDLQSEENYPTTRDYTFSYRKHCEVAKLEIKPDLAYETWLSAKRKIKSDEAVRRKEIEQQKRLELEERKRISKEKYDQWLDNKTQLQKQQQYHKMLNENSSSQTFNTQTSISEVSEKPVRSQFSEEEAQTRLDEWERTKRLQEVRRRTKRRQEEQRRRELEEQRRQAAAEAWDKWLADAAKKPKPVPLNRGIYTLRGTISDIFVNPNEWQPILPNSVDANGDH